MANANRVVSVRLRVDTAQAVTSTRALGTAIQRTTQQLQRMDEALGRTTQRAGQRATSAAATHLGAVQQSIATGTRATSAAVTDWQNRVQSGAAATTAAVSSGVGTWSHQLAGGAGTVGRAVSGWQSQVTSQSAATAASMSSVAGTWSASVQRGSAATTRALSSTSSAATSAGRAVSAAARDSHEAWSTAGAGVAASGAAMAAGFLAAAHATLTFDKQMSAAKAVLEPTKQEFDALRQAALDAGKSTVFTATESAEAITELGRAGVSAADILGGGLKGALDLAAAGQISTAEAAEVASDAMTMFGLKGRDLTHVADLLSAGANKSSTDVHGMSLALRQAGLLASQTGLSIEDTTAALAMFAAAGLKGSDAGTSLKVMLQMLNPKSDEAKALMEQLGFSAYDAQGNFIGLSATAQALQNSMSKLTPEARNAAMATIFGTDAVRAATILYTNGASGVDKWTNAVNDQGAAARTSSVMLDNLSGDIEALGGSLEVALIESGSGATKVLREMVQALTAVVNWFSNLPPGMQTAIVLVAAVTAVVGLLGGALLLIVPRLIAMRAAMQQLAATAPYTAAALRGVQAGLGILGAGLAVATAVVSLFGSSKKKATAHVEEFTSAIKQDSGAIGQNTKAVAAQALETSGATKAAQRFGISLQDLTDAATGDKAALERVNAVLNQHRGELDTTAARTGKLGKDTAEAAGDFATLEQAIKDVSDSTSEGKAAQDRLSQSTKDQTDSSKKQAQQAQVTADQLGEQKSAVDVLKDALDRLNGVHISSTESAISFQAAVAKITESVKENGTSLDINTEKGRANMGAFLDAAKAAGDHAQAVTDETGSVRQGTAVLQGHIDQLRQTLHQMGFNEQQINDLIGAYVRIPTDVNTSINADVGRAIGNIGRLKGELDSIPRSVGVSVRIGSGWFGMNLAPEADGGVLMPRSVQRFGDGAHVAQIAPAGAWRVWAEEETGGEAYIPLAQSKRNRSAAILRDVADRFGMDLAPRGRLMPARALVGAGQAASGSGPGGHGVNFSIGTYYAGDQSAHDVATDLWWQYRARG